MRADRTQTARRAGGRARLALSLAAAALLTACPELETPIATVSGRIVGASPGAYVYPLERPDLRASVATDGSWVLHGVPTTVEALVLFDGGPFPTGRAELVAVELDGGALNRLPDRFGGAAAVDPGLLMPLAAEVIATVTVDGGATIQGPSFTVAETEHQAISPASGAQVTIYPLPAGTWDVSASLPGFVSAQAEVQAQPGIAASVTFDLAIDVNLARPGCAALPGCDGGLTCNPADGRCN
ncbi:MAG TPA: hypothetical protein VLT47_13525 [Anaeromyxobacteraceae bacterium]|nr:hypothetical protein [Anaeromyxobacteraceae bacterium]